MNSLDLPQSDRDRVYFRSMATRGAHELPDHLPDVIDVLKGAGFDLVIVETPGIGQGDAAIVPFVDSSLYVMTPEFGAASQLEKIDMLDSPTSWPSTSSSAAGPTMRCATSGASWCATVRRSANSPPTCRSSAPRRPASTTTASPRSTSTCAAC